MTKADIPESDRVLPVELPQSNGRLLPSPEETAWMTDEERHLMERFDRRDYDTFLRLSDLYHGGGWLVPYCRYVCSDASDLGDDKLLQINNRLGELLDDIRQAAETGNGRAMNALGVLHQQGFKILSSEDGRDSGSGIPFDKSAALEWFRKSAETGCLQGMRNYAMCLMRGIGCRWWTEDGRFDRDVMKKDREESLKWYQALSDRGDVQVRYNLACQYAVGRNYRADSAQCARWLRFAAESGHAKAVSVVSLAGEGASDKRLRAELLIALALEQNEKRPLYHDPYEGLAFSIAHPDDVRDRAAEAHGKDWLLKGAPEGTVVPPPASRETVRTPNLKSANPSFAARLIILVRDRFGNDAPSIYRAAHVSRKTYSAIVSNELRTVSKQTAVAFALALRLSAHETNELLKSAGFSLSDFILEDMIVKACIQTGIYALDEVNEILATHGAKIFPKGEDVS